MMFVGAYWAQRKESLETCAERIVRFLSAIAGDDVAFASWFLKGRTKAGAQLKLRLYADEIAARLQVNSRDLDGSALPELGYSLGIWNGKTVSFSATIGAYSPHIQNSVVLSFIERPTGFGELRWWGLLDAAVRAFEPDYGVVTSTEHLASKGVHSPWEAGLFTYARGGQILKFAFE